MQRYITDLTVQLLRVDGGSNEFINMFENKHLLKFPLLSEIVGKNIMLILKIQRAHAVYLLTI